jgi:hypothetical protein
MPAPRAVPFFDLEDLGIPFEHEGKIVGNVRAKHLVRNELMAWRGKCGLRIIDAFWLHHRLYLTGARKEIAHSSG